MLDLKEINRSEAAKATGVDLAHVSRIFNRKVNPSLSLAVKLANHLQVSLEELCLFLGVGEARPTSSLALRAGRERVVIEGVDPEIDGGRFPIKRIVGEEVVVQADIFADGYDLLSSALKYRKEGDPQWAEVPMKPLVNDRWQGTFTVTEMGIYRYSLVAWVDAFRSWRFNLTKKVEAGQDVTVDLLTGASLVEAAVARSGGKDAARLRRWASSLRSEQGPVSVDLALGEELCQVMTLHPDRQRAVTYPKELRVVVDRERARFNSWYEMFPRSCAPTPGQHGTFKDCEARLPYVASMGFDVLYLPPVHPIGHAYRKGKNNAPVAEAEDPGSPWAIGSQEGGHKAVHSQLGTLEEFRQLVAKAGEHGLEVALDVAFQCTSDHPYVKEHPEWFRRRPDGTVQYAENPPKRYEDIYPFDFETENWEELWKELRSVVLFWIEQGVRIFRVDNPHTKPFRFWEWLIAQVKEAYPDVLFLSEAFTRPKVMYHLAKLGFTQSYTYFTWRNTKWDLTQYFTELTQTQVREFFRPSLWPNTPDILSGYLQVGGRPAFMARLVLAATLGASYGIYGPAFELGEALPREPGSEEYLDSEKYQLRRWRIDRPDSLRDFIARVNRIRRQNPALQSDWSLRFHRVDNDHLICYSKKTPDSSNVILVVVNLDHRYVQSGWVELPLEEMGIGPQEQYQMHDLLSDARYIWNGPRNYVELNPQATPAHIFQVRHRVHRERDFDYYM